MSVTLRVLLLIGSVLTAFVIVRRIGKAKVKQEDSLFWLFFSLILALLGIFPNISYRMSTLLGFVSPSNFVFLLVIALLLEKLLTVSIQVSVLENKVEVMAAELALRSKSQDLEISKIKDGDKNAVQ